MSNRKRTASVASLCALAIGLGASLSGCGQATSAPVDPGVASAAEASLGRLYLQITGSQAQRSAGVYVQYRSHQDAIVGCMAKQGQTYEPPAFVDTWSGWQSEGGAGHTEWLAPLSLQPVTPNAQVLAVVQRAHMRRGEVANAYTRLADEEKRRYDAALDKCAPPDNGYDEVDHPPLSAHLQKELNALLQSVDNQMADHEGAYRGCMAERGIDVASRESLLDQIEAALPQRLSDIPAPGSPDNPSWARAKEQESRLASVDVRCRRAAHDEGYMLLAPKLAEFERERAAELTAVQRDWNEVVSRAASLRD